MIFVELSNSNGTWRFASEFHRGSRGVWKDAILQISPIEMGIRHSTGGYAYTNWGSITLVPSEIDLEITQFEIQLAVGEDDSSLNLLFKGIAYLNSVTESSVTLDIYGQNLSLNLLREAGDNTFVDQSGSYLRHPVIGECIGTQLTYIPCLQFDPAGGDIRFWKMSITGDPGTNYLVHDDGVDITDHVSANYTTAFDLDVDPVGQVTISGNAHYNVSIPYDPYDYSRLYTSVFDWIRTKLSPPALLKSYKYWGPYNIYCVSKFVNSQIKIIDFLDQYSSIIGAISYFRSPFYGTNDRWLYVFPMKGDFESGIYPTPDDFLTDYPDITEYFTFLNQDFINWEIYRPTPIKEIRGEWTRRIAVTDRTGAHLKDERFTYSIDTGLAVGNILNTNDFYKYESFITDVSILLNVVNKERFKIVYHLTDELLTDFVKFLPGSVVGFYKPANCHFPIADDKIILLIVTNTTIDFEKYILTIRGVVQ